MQKKIYKTIDHLQAEFSLSGTTLRVEISSDNSGMGLVGRFSRSTLPINMFGKVNSPQELLDLIDQTDEGILWVSDSQELMIPYKTSKEDILLILQLNPIRQDSLLASQNKLLKQKIEKLKHKLSQKDHQKSISQEQPSNAPNKMSEIEKINIKIKDLQAEKEKIEEVVSTLTQEVTEFKDTIQVHMLEMSYSKQCQKEKVESQSFSDSEELINSLFVKNEELSNQILQLKESFEHKQKDISEIMMMKEIRLFPKVAKHTNDHANIKEEQEYDEEEVTMKKTNQKEKSSSEPSTYNESWAQGKFIEPSFGFSLHSSQKAGPNELMMEEKSPNAGNVLSTYGYGQASMMQELQMLNMVSTVKISELQQKVRQLTRNNETLEDKIANLSKGNEPQ